MIKVTVTFEESKPSRIDALLKEYDSANNLANETKRELAPIIEEVGLAKHAAIMKQLKPIMDGMKKLSILKHGSGVSLCAYYQHPGVGSRKFMIVYGTGANNYERFDIKHCIALSSYNDKGDNFKDTSYSSNSNEYDLMFGAYRGIVTHWNGLNIVDKLNEDLEKTIQREIEMAISRKNRTECQLNNLINC